MIRYRSTSEWSSKKSRY